MGEPNDYGYAILGAFLVSLATSLHIFYRARTTGFNSFVYSILTWDRPSIYWKSTMIGAIICASGIAWHIFGFSSVDSDTSPFFDSPSTMISNLSCLGFALSGLFVGFGAKLSHGCTSGHLICGIPRRSIRSLVAVIVYMATAFMIANLRYEEPFLDDTETVWVDDTDYTACISTVTALAALFIIVTPLYFKFQRKAHDMFNTMVLSILVGFLFAFGMIFGGMSRRSKVMTFLDFGDGSLGTFFVAVILFNLLFFYYLMEKKYISIIETPIEHVTWRLILGAIFFGLGWGIGGICPGPSFVLFMFMTPHISLIWLVALIVGQFAVSGFEMLISKIGNGGGGEDFLNYE